MRIAGLLTLLLMGATHAATTHAATTDVVDRVVADVNGVMVFLSELEEELGPNVESAPTRVRRVERRDALQRLIDGMLLEREAIRLGLQPPTEIIAEAVEERVAELAASWPDLHTFEQMLATRGETPATLRLRLRAEEERAWRRRSVIMARMDSPPEQIDFATQWDLRQVLLACDPDASEALSNAVHLEALDLRAELLEGERDFQALAAERSDDAHTAARGGALGLVEQTALAAPIAEALEGLSDGDISRPVRTRRGWYLFEVVRLITPRQRWTMAEFRRARESLLADLRARGDVKWHLEETP